MILGGLSVFFFPHQPVLSKAQEATRIPTGTNPCSRRAQSKLCFHSAIPSDIPALISFVSIITLSISSLLTRKASRKNASKKRHCYHPQEPRGQPNRQQITAEFPSSLAGMRFGRFLGGQKTTLFNFIHFFQPFPRRATIGTSPFLSPGGTTGAVLPSLPGSGFASSQPNWGKSCLQKCWLVELMDKPGCSPREGNLEGLRWHKTSRGNEEESEPKDKTVV